MLSSLLAVRTAHNLDSSQNTESQTNHTVKNNQQFTRHRTIVVGMADVSVKSLSLY